MRRFTMKLSDYVMQRLVQAGATHVFLVPGGAAMHLNNSLAVTPGLAWTPTYHEQAAATAAECHSKYRNRIGVAMVTAGPGSTNALTAVASAWVNSAPLVVIAGQVKSTDLKTGSIRQNGLQEIDAVAMAAPVTKYAATVVTAESVRYHLDKALHFATSGRPGPVWLSFPQDVQAADVDPDTMSGFEAEVPPAEDLSVDVDRLIDALNASTRPVLLAGLGIRLSGACEKFLELADILEIPIQTTWAALDVLPNDHRFYAGRPGAFATRGSNFTIQNSDFMFALGARLDLATTGFSRQQFARAAFRVAVDIDPDELSKVHGVFDLAICAGAGRVIDELLAKRDRITRATRDAWWKRVRAGMKRYPIVTPEKRGLSDATSTYVLVEKIASLLSEGDVIVEGSSGVHAEIFFPTFVVKNGQRVLTDASLGSMGYGLPAAIGACVAAGKKTYFIEGDGSLQPHLQELQTIKRDRLPIKIVIVNNGGYSSIRVSQGRYFNRLVAADDTSGLTLPSVAKIAGAYGIRAWRVERESELDETLREAFAGNDPAIVDVVVPRDEDRVPRLANYQKANGQMISKPLEDMFPFLDRAEFLENMLIPPVPED